MAGCICKCHCQIVTPGHSPGPGTRHSSRLRELGHVLNVERQNLVSEVSPRATISRTFHGLEDPIEILDAATDTMSQTYTHTHAHITYPIPLTCGTGPCTGTGHRDRTLCWETLFTPDPHLLLHDAPLGKADNLIPIR